MAHEKQRKFCQSVRHSMPEFFHGRIVVDIGSLDINGNNTFLFQDCMYIGVDLLPGRNVDVCCRGHELSFPDESVDLVISTECLEHDLFYQLTLKNIARILKPGGLLIFTCAFTGRPEHGTRLTSPQDAPFVQEFDAWNDYYKNLDEGDIRSALNIEEIFERHAFSTDLDACDLYFWGIKRGVLLDRNDYSFLLRRNETCADLGVCEASVVELKKFISAYKERIDDLSTLIAERDAQIANLSRLVTARERQTKGEA